MVLKSKNSGLSNRTIISFLELLELTVYILIFKRKYNYLGKRASNMKICADIVLSSEKLSD